MSDLQQAKTIVVQANNALDAAQPGQCASVLARHVSTDYRWRGMHPFDELHGHEAVAGSFWNPLKTAFGQVQRRPDIFLAGLNQLDDWSSTWVVEMGHLMGLWDRPWLGLAPSHKVAFLRYVEFHRITENKIVETACYVDILNLLEQVGRSPIKTTTGVQGLSPSPRFNTGLLYEPEPAEEGRITVELIAAMVTDLRENAVNSPDDHMESFWVPDMCWFGPGGIGSSAFFEGYRKGHSGPFEQGLEYVHHKEHVARIGEGCFGGFFGYPSLTLRSTGGFLGLPESEIAADMRIVDLYRREGDKLAENWIFIDIPHFFSMQGIDLLRADV